MAFFPMFVDLSDKNVLVVGGGKVATRKLKSLLMFKPKITVVSKKVSCFIKELAEKGVITLRTKSFEPKKDIKDSDLVIVAIDDIDLQRTAYEICKKNNIPINCSDGARFSSFIFPSVVVRDDFVVGISTSGKAPSVSKKAREILDIVVPDNIGAVIKEIEAIRRSVLEKNKKEEIERYLSKLKWKTPLLG
ncbi:precorrin-2 dehydrogenase/sirohydrochlorin ferrochelatase family protein [Hippea maritima]|uniref:precorrin-2 dehydrogenase n=1 Tax=Hippea maritima (strain ATCC 700847 / DSM 10411 / MH2) TaxID=760142 RepID=F2LU99_HIPMA|nr:bifunctional precorrin-2 dehydrogenase/sirohydrochlorin ferrochelatase [Hippea maritima]AEA34562.1 siroheme synthase [Hippea maritima DSM 10411]